MKPTRTRRSGRVGFLDEIRGLDLLTMAFYHGCYDLVYLFGVSMPAFHGPAFRMLQLCICTVFILISGACCHYSRSNLRRGLQTLAVALMMSTVTILFMPAQAIRFGILHFMGSAMVIYALCAKCLRRIPPIPGFLLMLVVFRVLYTLPNGTVGIPGLFSLSLPAGLYSTSWLFPLGFMGPGFYSADYFPILPYIFLFFAGSYIGLLFQEGKMPRFLYKTRVPFLAKLGQHSLLFYVLHQPTLFVILSLYFRLFRG